MLLRYVERNDDLDPTTLARAIGYASVPDVNRFKALITHMPKDGLNAGCVYGPIIPSATVYFSTRYISPLPNPDAIWQQE